jgi:hypothetical protein
VFRTLPKSKIYMGVQRRQVRLQEWVALKRLFKGTFLKKEIQKPTEGCQMGKSNIKICGLR